MNLTLLLLLACTRGEFSLAVDQDDDGSPSDLDCNDANPDLHPDASEICDGLDNDCDGAVDDDDPSLVTTDATAWFGDADGDGHGSGPETRACVAPEGFVPTADDCDDADPSVNPSASERCDGIDNDCNSLIDDQPTDGALAFVDSDGDGVGGPLSIGRACEPSPGVSLLATDCNDDDPSVVPGGQEVCGGGDEDCDGAIDDLDDSVDESSFNTFFVDTDGDGSGSLTPVRACDEAPGRAASSDDCNDDNPAIHPTAAETCNGIDDDCDTLVDDEDPLVDKTGAEVFYPDLDADGFGDDRLAEQWCSGRLGITTTPGDCDDTNAQVNPSGREVCDGRDNNCDTLVDTALDEGPSWQVDRDGDGYGDPTTASLACEPPASDVVSSELGDDCDDADPALNPGAKEICNSGIDENCDDSPAPCGLRGAVPLLDAERQAWEPPFLTLPNTPTVWWEQVSGQLGGRLDFTDTRPLTEPSHLGVVQRTAGHVGYGLHPFTADLDGQPGNELYVEKRGEERFYRIPFDPSVSLFDQVPYSDSTVAVASWLPANDWSSIGGTHDTKIYTTAHTLVTVEKSGNTSIVRVGHSWPAGVDSALVSRFDQMRDLPQEGDVNGDGEWDLIFPVAYGHAASTAVFLGPWSSSMNFSDADYTSLQELLLQPDVNEDGASDISWSYPHNDVNIPGIATSLFSWSELTATDHPDGSRAHTHFGMATDDTPLFGDFDGDAHLDAALMSSFTSGQPAVRIFHGPLSGDITDDDATGYLVDYDGSTDVNPGSSPVVSDLDGDGRADLLMNESLFRGGGL